MPNYIPTVQIEASLKKIDELYDILAEHLKTDALSRQEMNERFSLILNEQKTELAKLNKYLVKMLAERQRKFKEIEKIFNKSE